MVTVLIFSYNRHGYLKRAIDYWSQSGWSIIIADGSDMSLQCNFPSNIDYLHCPSASISDRLEKLVEKVTTPYALLSADDDFIAFDGLRRTTEFLSHHSDYASAQGFYTRFQQDGDSRIRWFWDYRHASKYVFDEDSLASRFLAAMSPPPHALLLWCNANRCTEENFGFAAWR